MKAKFCFFLLLMQATAFAQRGNSDFMAALEAGFPTGKFDSYKTGIGGQLKALIGVEDHGQVTFMAGYESFKAKGSTDNYKVKMAIIPVLLGYRHHFSLLYVEPAVGYGSYKGKVKAESGNVSTTSTSSKGALTAAFGAGVEISALDLGLRYQIGFPSGPNIGFFGISVGYHFRTNDRHR